MRAELVQIITAKRSYSQASSYADALMKEAIDMSVEEPDWQKWQSGGTELVGGIEYRDLLTQDAQKLRAQAWRLYYENCHVRNVVRTLVKFVFGKGVNIKLNETRPDFLSAAKEYWDKWMKQNKWALKQKEIATRSWRDGEAFIHTRNLGAGRPPRLEFANPDRVKSDDPDATYGIRMDPDDPTQPMEYIIDVSSDTKSGKKEMVIPANRIVHIKTCVDSDVKRGRTILEPILRPTKLFDEWVKDRMVLNKVRSALAVVRTVTGTPGQIRTITQTNKSSRASGVGQDRQKTWRPGTIITASPGVDYKMLSANINANDAAQDGKNILLTMAVGVGFPEMYMTGDFSSTNFASSSTAQNPFVRECEDQQDFFEPHIQELVDQVFAVGVENGDLPEDMNTAVTQEWPPLIQRDLVALVTALMQLFNARILSRRTVAARTGFDFDHEKDVRFEEDVEKAVQDELLGVPEEDNQQTSKAKVKPPQHQEPRPQGKTKQKVKINVPK